MYLDMTIDYTLVEALSRLNLYSIETSAFPEFTYLFHGLFSHLSIITVIFMPSVHNSTSVVHH